MLVVAVLPPTVSWIELLIRVGSAKFYICNLCFCLFVVGCGCCEFYD